MSARGCALSLLAFMVAGVLILWFVLPPVMNGLAGSALRSTGLEAADMRVEVSADPPLRLLFLVADRVHVKASGVTIENVQAESMDITLRDVNIRDRTFGVIEGSLTGAIVTPTAGPAVKVGSVQLSGPSEATRATMRLDHDTVAALIHTSMGPAAGNGDVVLSSPDRVTVGSGSGSVTGRVVVSPGGELQLEVRGGQTFSLLATGPDQPMQLRTVQVDGDGLEVGGTVKLLE